MTLKEKIIWQRLRLASWIVGKHVIVKNADIGKDGKYGIYVGPDKIAYLCGNMISHAECSLGFATNTKARIVGSALFDGGVFSQGPLT